MVDANTNLGDETWLRGERDGALRGWREGAHEQPRHRGRDDQSEGRGQWPDIQRAVVGYDVAADVAVVQLKSASELKTVPIGSSSAVKVGAR